MPQVVVNGSVTVIEVAVDEYTVAVESWPVQVVTVGVQGPQGPQGPAGTGGATYVFDQPTPATTWNIAHNLGQYPAVTVVDSGGTQVLGDVTYVDENNITLVFNVAFGGKCFLNV